MKINFVPTHKNTKLPEKNHKDPLTGDAGFDIFAVQTITIPPQSSAVVPVGLTVAYVTPGYWFKIEGRSGLGFKQSLQPHFGVIDNSYRGKVGVKIYNLSKQVRTIEEGQAVAQMIVYKMVDCRVGFQDEISEVSEGGRGIKGFGSSDKQQEND